MRSRWLSFLEALYSDREIDDPSLPTKLTLVMLPNKVHDLYMTVADERLVKY